MARSTAPPIDLDELARRVAPLVVAQLSAALGAVAAPFSTRRGFEPPEYSSRPKRWKRDAPTIPGAVRVGRWVSVSRSAYAAWLEAKSATPVVHRDAAPAPPSTWSARAALEAAGLRKAG
jgi:hypothetical protein